MPFHYKALNSVPVSLRCQNRILARGEEEGCWCMENIELARVGSASLPGIHVQTDSKTVDGLCDEVLNQVR